MNQATTTESDSEKLERYELALKASNEGIWDWWILPDQMRCSRRVLEFLECSDNSMPRLFAPPFEHVHPDDRKAYTLAIQQALAMGGPEFLSIDARLQTGSGDWRWLRIRGAIVRDRHGEAVRIAGSMIDVSRRKDAEAQLEEERFLLRQLIDHVPLQVYFKDLDSHFVMVNQRMCEWVGMDDPMTLVGRHDRDFFDDNHSRQAQGDERKIMESGEPMTGMLEKESWHEGGETWVLTSKFPWRDRKGRMKGTFGVSSDVTSLVLAERRASELAEELGKRNEAYEEELMLAREIQQALTDQALPKVEYKDSTLRFRARYVPISGLAGDFFDVRALGPDKVAVLICDVMGHGVRSALIVAMLRGLLEEQRTHRELPSEFLTGLNEGLCAILQRAGTTMFATACYLVLDLENGTLECAIAGHPGPMAAYTDGTVAQLMTDRGAKGPGLGLIPGAAYPTMKIPLNGLRRMVLFTDGVLEAENEEGEPFFETRLRDIIAVAHDSDLEPMLDTILAKVLEFSDARHFDDDVCLVGLEIDQKKSTA